LEAASSWRTTLGRPATERRSSGGFSTTPPKTSLRDTPLTVGEYTLVAPPISELGYLKVTVDLSKPQGHLTIVFNDRTNTKAHDTVRVNLKTGKILKH
jgi:hypothetical protein